MNPYEAWLKSFAIGLETMAKGIHSIAKTLYDIANPQVPDATGEATPTRTGEGKPASIKAEKKVDDMTEAQAPEKPVEAKSVQSKKATSPSKKAAKRKAKPSPKKVIKKPKPKGKTPVPADERVFEILKKSKGGVNNSTIVKNTGLDKKQVANALLKLKKAGKIKSAKRGVYTVA